MIQETASGVHISLPEPIKKIKNKTGKGRGATLPAPRVPRAAGGGSHGAGCPAHTDTHGYPQVYIRTHTHLYVPRHIYTHRSHTHAHVPPVTQRAFPSPQPQRSPPRSPPGARGEEEPRGGHTHSPPCSPFLQPAPKFIPSSLSSPPFPFRRGRAHSPRLRTTFGGPCSLQPDL